MSSNVSYIKINAPYSEFLRKDKYKREAVIAIFDIGKTNKKLFLLDAQYKIVYEKSIQLPETTDEDGFACEDLHSLIRWVKDSVLKISTLQDFEIRAINFSTYGASLVHLDDKGKPIAPLYNYLKPFSQKLSESFYNNYGGKAEFSQLTASPVLGSLNSGLQLYRLKYEQPELFNNVRFSLHLPQYISSLVTGKYYSDITSIGCHTGLWNFRQNKYHQWLYDENIISKLPDIFPSDQLIGASVNDSYLPAGVGLHDSSAALIPYLAGFTEPFILISTGTWCISLNPFNASPLTGEELQKDCLCYLTYHGKAVKASRLFAGYEHEQQINKLAEHYNKRNDYYKVIKCEHETISRLRDLHKSNNFFSHASVIKQSVFGQRDLAKYAIYEDAYHQLMMDIIVQQKFSTQLVLNGSAVKRIFVDGGFSNNPIYMYLLAEAFPELEVYSASVAQATAVGAALAIHEHWNDKQLPADIIELKYYNIPGYMPL